MSEPIYIVRHGQTDWNVEFRLQGQSETDLNEVGRGQAAGNGRLLARLIDDPSRFAFLASPMKRTRQTLEIIRGALGLPSTGYGTDPRLVEVHFGDWEAYTFAELEKKMPGSSTARDHDKWGFLPPGAGAESYAMMAERVRPWLNGLAGPIVVVTHGGVIRAMFNILNGLSGPEAAVMEVPQDRVAAIENGRIGWISSV